MRVRERRARRLLGESFVLVREEETDFWFVVVVGRLFELERSGGV